MSENWRLVLRHRDGEYTVPVLFCEDRRGCTAIVRVERKKGSSHVSGRGECRVEAIVDALRSLAFFEYTPLEVVPPGERTASERVTATRALAREAGAQALEDHASGCAANDPDTDYSPFLLAAKIVRASRDDLTARPESEQVRDRERGS